MTKQEMSLARVTRRDLIRLGVAGGSAAAKPPGRGRMVSPTRTLLAKTAGCVLVATLAAIASTLGAGDGPAAASRPSGQLLTGRFQWRISQPLIAPVQRKGELDYSVKDPSSVFHEGKWHLFVTVRGREKSHRVDYLSFDDFSGADTAKRHTLSASDGYFCAPQVFYFAPQKKWYMICQAANDTWQPKYQAAYATTTTLADPKSWSKLRPLGAKPGGGKTGLDFWVICDAKHAYLFFTTLNGQMWREQTPLANFPAGWSEAKLALRGDIFEASHTYRLKGMDRYLTLVEAQGGRGWRYYKAYLADRLDGPWQSLAATKDRCFASMANTAPAGQRWTDCISHGELLRAGTDQTLEVDPKNLRLLFQGVLNRDRAGKPYGKIPWRLGLLDLADGA